MAQDFTSFIINNLSKNIKHQSNVYLSPIPEKVLKTAVNNFVTISNQNNIICLFDTSTAKKGSSGVAICDDYIYFKENKTKSTFSFELKNIINVQKANHVYYKAKQNLSLTRYYLIIRLKNKEVIILDEIEFNKNIIDSLHQLLLDYITIYLKIDRKQCNNFSIDYAKLENIHETLIEIHKKRFQITGDTFYVAPNISNTKITNVLKNIALHYNENEEKILAIKDCTFFNTSAYGIVFTNNAIYLKSQFDNNITDLFFTKFTNFEKISSHVIRTDGTQEERPYLFYTIKNCSESFLVPKESFEKEDLELIYEVIYSINNNANSQNDTLTFDLNTSAEVIREMIKERCKTQSINYHIAPNINSTILNNAVSHIANKEVDTSIVIAILDSSLANNGKNGLLFTYNQIFIKETAAFAKKKIDIDKIRKISVPYGWTEGKPLSFIKIQYITGEEQEINEYEVNNEIHLIYDVLKYIIENQIPTQKTKVQYESLSELGNDVIEDYLRIVIYYLQSVNGKIDSKGYKEIIGLMAKINVPKDVAAKMSKERLNINKIEQTPDSLVAKLSYDLRTVGMDLSSVFQSLFKDLLLCHKENIDNWDSDIILKSFQQLLRVENKQVLALVRTLKNEERIIKNRLKDNQVKDILKETAAVIGAAQIPNLVMSLTGMMLTPGVNSVVAILAFTQLKRLFNTSSNLEKAGIRVALLEKQLENNKKAVTYLIDDINMITQKVSEICKKQQENISLDNELMAKLADFNNSLSVASISGVLLEEDNNYNDYEIIISSLPAELDYNRFVKAVEKLENQSNIRHYILSVYKKQDINKKISYIRDDELPYNVASKTYAYLENINYFA